MRGDNFLVFIGLGIVLFWLSVVAVAVHFVLKFW